jgi:hypothetical protein
LASDAKVFVDAAHLVPPLQAVLRPVVLPVVVAVAVGVLPVVPVQPVVPQVVARQTYQAALGALEQVAAQVPSVCLEQKSLEPLVVQAQAPVLMPEQVPQVALQVQM